MLDFLCGKELQQSIYLYLPEQNRLGTYSVSEDRTRLHVWVAHEFTGVEHNVEGVGPIVGYLKPPTQWHHLTFIHEGEESSMYHAYERLLSANIIPVVRLDELTGATHEPTAVPVRRLLLREDTPEIDAYHIKEIVARRVPIDFTLRHDLDGLHLEPLQ